MERLFRGFILLMGTYLFFPMTLNAQSVQDLDSLFNQFEKELIYSNESAQKIAEHIIDIAEKENSDKSRALSNTVRAIKAIRIDDSQDKAIIYAQQALHTHTLLRDSLKMFRNIRTLYTAHYLKKQYDSAILYAIKEVELSSSLNTPSVLITAYLDMGDIYYYTRQHKKVKLYRWKAYSLAKKYNLKKQLSDISLKLAQSHLRLSRQRTQKALDSAIFYGRRALKYAKEAGYQAGVHTSSVVLADFLNVAKYHKEALELIETVANEPEKNIPSQYKHETPFYYAVILKDNGDYSKAKKIILKEIAKLQKGDYELRMSHYFFVSVLYAYLDQPDSTNFAIKQGIIANNARSENLIYDRIAELQTQYETEKKEQKIRELEQEKEIEKLEIEALQRQRLILGLSFLAPLGFIFAGGWYVNRRRLRLQLEAEQKERAKEQSELKALRSQMNPHFIFNALNSIQDFIMLSEKENAQHYLSKFAILMRGFLDSSSKETTTFEKELPLIKSYIELEGLRLGDDFDYEIKFENELSEEDIEDIELPPLLIQPYLENAFKHGLLHKNGKKKLTLAFEEVEKSNMKFLQLEITDNGVGRLKSAEINERKRKMHQSFATQATQERLELLKNQSLPNKNIEVTINDLVDNGGNAEGTKVVILIPTN